MFSQSQKAGGTAAKVDLVRFFAANAVLTTG